MGPLVVATVGYATGSNEAGSPERLHIFQNTPFNQTQAKNVIKKSVSKTFNLTFENYQIYWSLVFYVESGAYDSDETQYSNSSGGPISTLG